MAGALQKALSDHGVLIPQNKSSLVQCLSREEHTLHQTKEITNRRIPNAGVCCWHCTKLVELAAGLAVSLDV